MHIRSRSSTSRRRGAVLAEAAIVMLVFLMLVLGMIDLGIAVQRQQVVSRAARQAARLAIVHGRMAPSGWNGGPWGTATIDQQANATEVPIVAGLVNSGALSGLDLTQTRIKVEWLDGTNDPEAERNRVRTSVKSKYEPMITFIFGSPTFTLGAASTMNIAH